MTLEQWLGIGGMAIVILQFAMVVGMWRGRQEAADKAASNALANAEQKSDIRIKNLSDTVDLRMQTLEAKVDGQGQLINQRIVTVDRDLAGVKDAIQELKSRHGASEQERREEFQRLHKIANETHALIVQHQLELHKTYLSRTEYESRHDALDRRVSRLEDGGDA